MSNPIHYRTTRRKALLGAAAAGIGMKASSVFAAPSLLQGGDQVTLEVWGGVPVENGPGDLIDGFHAAFPDIRINYTHYVNNDTGNTQLDTALQGGTPIDVFFTYAVARMGQRIGAGATLDLTDYVEADAGISEWVTGNEGIFRYEDRLYSLPTCSEPHFIFVNRNRLEDLGIEIPQAGWSVDDFVALSRELSTDESYGTYILPDLARMEIGPNYMFKDGGAESNFDHPAFASYLTLHKEMIDDGSAFPWTDVLAQDLKTFGQHVLFLIEQTILWPSASWVLQYLTDTEEYPREFITTFAPLPQPDTEEQGWNPGGINNWLQVNARTTYPDESWEFVRYWLTDGAQFMLKGGKIPAFPGTDEEAIVEGILGPEGSEIFDTEAYRRVALDPSYRLVVDTITTGASEVGQIFNGNRDRFLIGELSIEEWVSETKSQADTAISQAAS